MAPAAAILQTLDQIQQSSAALCSCRGNCGKGTGRGGERLSCKAAGSGDRGGGGAAGAAATDDKGSEEWPEGAKSAGDHLRKVFYRMGLSDEEIVALSGAHTLGRAKPSRSGFGKEVYPPPARTLPSNTHARIHALVNLCQYARTVHARISALCLAVDGNEPCPPS